MPRRQHLLLFSIAMGLLTTLAFLTLERTASSSSTTGLDPMGNPSEPLVARSDDGTVVLKLLSPRGPYLFGKQRVEVEVSLPSGDQVKTLDIFLDGGLRKAFTAPPYALEEDFGEEIRAHSLLVMVQTREDRAARLSWISRPASLQGRVEVSLVTVSVAVLDPEGRFREGLSLSDFILLEDGVPQTLVHFDQDPTPASIAVALDASESMRGTLWSAQKAANDFIASLPSFYKVCVIGFSDSVHVAREFTYDRRGLSYAVSSLKPAGGTALYDTLEAATRQLAGRPDRRIAVLFTDGGESLYTDDQAGRARLSQSLQMAREAGVTFYTIAFGPHSAAGLLQRIAEETGGAFYDSRDPSALSSIFESIGHTLNHQYALSYYPSRPLAEGGWRSVTIQVRDPGASVRARPGYLAAH
ncbi:MAG: VWA domain-containing protein [Acidobacteria bacterium]|nr:VWA domain-containing protein [Acidobacteriota bacterium]